MEVKEIPSFSEAQVRWIETTKRTQKKVGKQGGGWYRQRLARSFENCLFPNQISP